MDRTESRVRKGKPGRGSRGTGMESGALQHPEETTGQILQEARKRHNISIEAAARDLNIRREFLDAIEEDDFENLPTTAYAVGFVRSYAKYLRLDSPALVEQFRGEVKGSPHDAALHIPVPVRESRLPVGVLAIIALVMGGLAYGSWALYTQQDEGATGAQAGVTAPAAPKATPKPAMAKAETGAKAEPGKAAANKQTPKSPDVQQANAGSNVASSAGPAKAAGASGSSGADAPTAKVHAPGGTQKITLRATANTWIRVRDGENNVLFTRVLRQGDQYPVPGQSGIVVDIGNAGGLEILLNGRVLRPVGPSNMPVYNLSLNPDALIQREEAAKRAAEKKAAGKKQ